MSNASIKRTSILKNKTGKEK